MQGKGIIKFFLIVLALVCLVQYLYMVPTRGVERAADSYAAEIAAQIGNADKAEEARKKARVSFLDSMSSETIVSIPLVADYTYQELKGDQLAFGLDLKGGLSEVLQVNLKEFIISMSKNTKDPTFNTALESAETRLRSTQTDLVTLFGQEWAKVANGKKLAPIFARNAAFKDVINFGSPDEEVLTVLREQSDDAVKLTFKMLKDRIDRLGVVQPNISLDEARDLIIVELPGIDNPERAKKILSATAKLEFWDVYRLDQKLINGIAEADKRLKRETGDTTSVEPEFTVQESYDYIYDEANPAGAPIDSTLRTDTVYNQLDPYANAGPLLKNLTLNGQGGQLSYPSHVVGVADKNKQALIANYFEREDIKKLLPRDVAFKWGYKPAVNFESGEETGQYELYSIRVPKNAEKAPLTGEHVVSANSNPDPTSGAVNVSLDMDQEGARIWGEMTTKAATDNNRSIAIVLDDKVVSAPQVNGPITGGSSQISGSFSIQEGEDLASILEVGKLPTGTQSIQTSLVGPSLGKSNIRKSFISFAIGLGLLMIFMVLYYSVGGIVSIIALLANLFFIFGALSSFGTVITLPGLAGILLTIGMAVDANVIIYERIREELRAGKTMATAVADGFKHSYSAIIDANVTTFLVAGILAYYGLGPIKGFAVVLMIGVISSLVTAVLMGRMLIEWWMGKGNEMSFWTNISKNWFSNINIDWMSKRKISYTISAILVIASLASIMTRGFELGVDFKGGYSYTIDMGDTDVSAEQLRTSLTTAFGDEPVVKAVDIANTYSVTTSYMIDDTDAEAQNRVTAKLFEGVKSIAGGDLTLKNFSNPDGKGTHITASSKVGPTIADDIKDSSYKAAGFALLLIFLYILFRFRKWQYSLGAVLALFHDSIIVLGVFSIFHGLLPFSMEIDQAFIAALLTVIGYSINDTVVVFDRIREFLGIYVNKDKDEVINSAVNSTVSRTVITSLTTLFVVAILLVFGGGSIKGFAFALLVGILVGTYSSIFVATPVLRDLTNNLVKQQVQKKNEYRKAKKVEA